MWFFPKKDTRNDAALELAVKVNDLFDGHYVSRTVHEARVKELIDASNSNMERRREAEKEAAEAESDTLRALKMARQSRALVQGVDWASENLSMSSCSPAYVFDCIKLFAMGFEHQTVPELDGMMAEAYKAGATAAAKDRALSSAASAVGIMT